jgi:predicted RNA binding protein YcfA (HicA-like mRNA interferase family)
MASSGRRFAPPLMLGARRRNMRTRRSHPREASVEGGEVITMLEHDGWVLARTRGSHRQHRHRSKRGLVTVPAKPSDDLAPGTLSSLPISH